MRPAGDHARPPGRATSPTSTNERGTPSATRQIADDQLTTDNRALAIVLSLVATTGGWGSSAVTPAIWGPAITDGVDRGYVDAEGRAHRGVCARRPPGPWLRTHRPPGAGSRIAPSSRQIPRVVPRMGLHRAELGDAARGHASTRDAGVPQPEHLRPRAPRPTRPYLLRSLAHCSASRAQRLSNPLDGLARDPMRGLLEDELSHVELQLLQSMPGSPTWSGSAMTHGTSEPPGASWSAVSRTGSARVRTGCRSGAAHAWCSIGDRFLSLCSFSQAIDPLSGIGAACATSAAGVGIGIER